MIRITILRHMLVLETAAEQYWFDRLSRNEQQRYVRAHPGTHFRVTAPVQSRQKSEMRPEDRAPAPTPSDEITRASFSRDGVLHRTGTGKPLRTTDDTVAHWKGVFQGTPQQYQRALLENTGLEAHTHVQTSPLGVVVRTMGRDPSRPEQGNVLDATRSFARDRDGRLKVDHADLELHGDRQASGIAKHFLRNSVREYRRMGVHEVSTHANLDVGGYAWAKYGFLPEDADAWEGIRRHVAKRLRRVAQQLPASTVEHVTKLLQSKDARNLWKLSDLQEMVHDVRHDELAEPGVRRAREHMSLGKQLLLGSEWSGRLPLRHAEAMRRFDNYVGK